MTIDATYLRSRIQRLETVLREIGTLNGKEEDALYTMYRDACVEEFEGVMEQSGKLLRKRLADWFASNRQADRLTFKDLFRHAARHDLLDIEAVERWLVYRDNRQDEANNSGDGFSENTLSLLPNFLEDATALANVVEVVDDA
ncbi:MAG: nucleotidyltransferase substrate binding protein [Gammaproteobacteria bacterium]|nr:nucleotidyltransferase substrate binding protein [Gammaproteobacteria bacterium]MDE0508603.1 nucleotidyltransferase substrate binding protein [Gammaproteobacteria bacterium]